ncbi:hypothetical protein [Shouchella miscanthi]|nr:hypothetical protein [Shouchella miscanthi]
MLSNTYYQPNCHTPYKYKYTFQFSFNETQVTEAEMHSQMCNYIQEYLPFIIQNRCISDDYTRFSLHDHDWNEVGLLKVSIINDYTSKKIVCRVDSLYKSKK